MKESNNKTSGRSQGQGKSTEKSSRTTTSRANGSSSRGTASQSSGSGRTSRSNNPEGHNQYTKK